jgi:FtsP/CotA-like multicopper oxidase with cupredoxin domain
MNAHATPSMVTWIIRDAKTGKENLQAGASFEQGDYARVRIRNLAESMHPMQHPIHLHGQRFLVDSIDGKPNPDLGWKDVVLVPAGSEVTLTIEMSNPGTWVAHCHILEHAEAGMVTAFTVA